MDGRTARLASRLPLAATHIGSAPCATATAAAGASRIQLCARRHHHRLGPRQQQLRLQHPIRAPRSSVSLFQAPRPIALTTTRAASAVASSKMYTASFAFFEALWELGVTHCFVNLGSDHPSIIEAMVKGQREGANFPRIITCPNEMVALSMADGYARLTGEPQAVLIHVDVGTQGLGAAVHNASTGRVPVFVFAGLSPFTQDGELRGSRTEYIHWVQDVHDQRAIVAQYCRYSAELKTGLNVKQMVGRSLQFAKSDPKGPVYLCGAREVLEAEMAPYRLKKGVWEGVKVGGIDEDAAERMADALKGAKKPLVITGYAGRNHEFAPALVELADAVPALRVVDTAGAEVCFPADHAAWRGIKFGNDDSIREADVILVLDCDVPWVPTQCKPRDDAKIFHVDVDPIKVRMPVYWIDATERFQADCTSVVRQLHKRLSSNAPANSSAAAAREKEHKALIAKIEDQARPKEDGTFGSTHLSAALRKVCPANTIFAVEAVTNTGFVHDGLQSTLPGTWINCGGGGLGWSGGGAMGIKLAADAEAAKRGDKEKPMVVQIVGDGSFLFSVPGSVYWIARRYNIPILTIVLNNRGWNAPRRSLLLVHPDGLAAAATNDELNISIDNPMPDFGGIAKAAAGGELFAGRVEQAGELEGMLRQAIAEVQAGRPAVVDCKVLSGC